MRPCAGGASQYGEELARRPDPELRQRAVVRAQQAVEAFPSQENVLAYSRLLLEQGDVEESLRAWEALLERGGLPYATLAYSHSTYGGAELQHELIAGVERHCRPVRGHRQWIEDELWDPPEAVAGEYRVRRPIVCETPISIFAALPLALAHGHRYLVLANERSADEGSFTWQRTGEEVNHQWGKSLEAERLLDGYLRRHLLVAMSLDS